jgi:hypothetical protein
MNERGKMTTDNWWSFARGLYISVGALVIVLLPYIEKGLMELQKNEDVDLAAKAVLLSNFLNLVRLFLKS